MPARRFFALTQRSGAKHDALHRSFFIFWRFFRADTAHLLFLIVHDDADISTEHFVDLFVAGVHQQSAAPQVEELLLRGKNVEIFPSDAAQDLCAELLVAAPEQVPLPARGRDDQMRRLFVKTLQNIAFAEV